jgi:hypothetical protein
LGAKGQQHQLYKEVDQILGEDGLRTSVGDSREMGRLIKKLDQDKSGDERHWSPRIRLTRGLCRLA